ncbi:MAG: hypothetical protein EVA63_07240 [Halieaceae bacterium]|nr:MAG: hypothetical protein EVA63_07240 [Halieaceae bacterium]
MSLTDQIARSSAIDPTRSFCVSAPAGSGKTELLTQRLLALLARVDRPEQVLAITFTRKAASEMALRVLEKIDQAKQDAPISAEHERQTRQLALDLIAHATRKNWRLDDTTLNIRTIDSFCHELTRQMPILSGTGGLVEPVDNAQPLYEAAVRNFLAQAGEGEVGEGVVDLLRQFNNRWSKVSELLIALLGRRGDWGKLVSQHHDPAGAEAGIMRTLEDLTSHRLALIEERLGAQFQPLIAIGNEAQAVLNKAPLSLGGGAETLRDWQALVGMLLTAQHDWRKPGGVTIRQGFTPKSEAKAQFLAVLESLREDEVLREALIELAHLPDTQQDGAAWDLVVLISSLLPVLQAHLLLVFQQAGAVDHTHVSLAAIQALGPDELPTALAQRLDYQIEHMLVDEFQDTSASQAELLSRLMRGWMEHNQTGAAPRTLFVVGDAMQSIYGFRYADVSLFLEARQGRMGGMALEPLTLTQNFRSQLKVVKWVNEAFSELFGSEDSPHFGRVKHVSASSLVPDTSSSYSGVRIQLFQESENDGEATAIARQVSEIRRNHPSASIAVLVRAKGHAASITAALIEAGVPFAGDALQSLFEQPAIESLMSLCRWLANPADMVAALGLLRGPSCGVSLATISALLNAHPERPLHLLNALLSPPDSLPDDERGRLTHLAQALDWAQAKRDRLGLPIWVEQVWLRLGGADCLSDQELRCVECFFGMLRVAEQTGRGLDISWLQQEMSMAVVESADTVNGVEIMTLHKAKGLEFDYVFMPCLNKRTRALQRDLIRWHWHGESAQRELLIAANDEDKESRTLYNYMKWMQKKKDEEELKRLLYVGITRARSGVMLSASADWATDDLPPDAAAGSLLAMLLRTSKGAATLEICPAGDEEGSFSHDSLANGVETSSLKRLAQSALCTPSPAGREAETAPASVAVSSVGNRLERVTGTICHRVLELIAGEPCLPEADAPRVQAWIANNIALHTLTPEQAEHTGQRVQRLIALALSCEVGRWILSARNEAATELALSRLEAGECKTYVIDRIFVDEETNLRWIIDFKTSQPGDSETIEAFEARECEAHQSQLARYAELVRGAQWGRDVPIRTALYFPAIQRLAVLQ